MKPTAHGGGSLRSSLKSSLAPSSWGAPPAAVVIAANSARQHHQQLLDRLVVDDADPAQVGQAGRQRREGRADTGERGVGLVGRARRDRQRRAQLRVGLAHLGGEPRQPVGQRLDVVAGANLGLQERAGLIDQLRDLRVVGVGLVHQQPGRLDQPGQLGTGSVGRVERLVQQLAQPGVADAVDQRLRLLQQVGDVLADPGVVPIDPRSVVQLGRCRTARRHQVDVLLTDGRHALHGGGDVRREWECRCSAAFRRSTPLGFSPTDSTRPTATPR